MTEFGVIFEDPMSVMVFSTVTIGFLVAYALVTIWAMSQGKDSVFEIKPA
jgi:hypothetical protein